MNVKLNFEVEVPIPAPAARDKRCPPDLASYIRDCIDRIEHGDEGPHTHREWLTLRSLYRDLLKRQAKSNATKKVTELVEMLTPIMQKNGYIGT